MRGYETEVEISLGDDVYTCTVTWYPGSPPTRDDPGDGGEIDTPASVSRIQENGSAAEVPWATFVADYAAYCAVAPDAAEDLLVDKLLDLAQNKLADRFHDE